MRTLYEIINSAKDGDMPTHEECYWAMLCYEAMLFFDHKNLCDALMKKPEPEFIRKMKAENSFDMIKKAMNKSPKDWIGWDNDPSNPEYQQRRKIGNALFEKIANQVEDGK